MGFPLSGLCRKGIMRYDHPISGWPVGDPGLADDVFPRQHPPAMGITGIGAIVSQDEVFIRAYGHRAPGICAGIGSVRFLQQLAVDENLPLFDRQVLAREPNDPLDKLTVWVSGEVKDNDVTSLRRVEPIGDLADNQVLAIVHVWLHAGPLDTKVLDEGANQKEDEQGEDHCFDGFTQEGFDTLPSVDRIVGCFLYCLELGTFVEVSQIVLSSSVGLSS
jgi:hypothetical protein